MHFDESEFWSLGKGRVVRAVNPSDPDKSPKYCKFPFLYKGKEYNKCLPSKNYEEWCATTYDYG